MDFDTLIMRGPAFLIVLLLSGCAAYRGTAEDVTFTSSDGTVLAGSLVFPKVTSERYPAVVLLHGAEPATRSFVYRMQANIFLDRGFAVLLYDKRGAGESGGVYRAPFARLLEDGLAAVTFLRQDPRIDGDDIGIMSASESGWFTPELVSRAGNVRFAVNKVGPTVPVQDTIAWESYKDLRDAGVDHADAEAEVALMRRIWRYQTDPEPSELPALTTALDELTRDGPSILPERIRTLSPEQLHQLTYDPAPFLRELSVPMLYIYGGTDINVPTEQCVRRLNVLKAAGKPLSYHVYPEAGHELGSIWVLPPFYRFEPGYAQMIGDFAEAHRKPR